MEKTDTASWLKKIKNLAKKFKPKPLKPRGILTRPAGVNLAIEIFDESGSTYPHVRITPEAEGKMRALVAACPVEVMWMSPITEDGAGACVYDVFVPYQICTPGTTEKLVTDDYDAEVLLLDEMQRDGQLQAYNHLACWGHSHVNGWTNPSWVDEQQTSTWLQIMRGQGKTRFVRLIANKGDDLSASLYLLDEGRAIHHAPLVVAGSSALPWMEWARKEVANKVFVPEPTPNMVTAGDDEYYF
jgi:hypothetical protein